MIIIIRDNKHPVEEYMTDNWLWWRDGIIYQIYPRSFQDSNNDGIGDLRGIIQRLDHLKTLGVDAIWLSPFYPSPDVDFGYDVSDYTGIDPKYGTMQDFADLIKQAHQRNIHIVVDLVLNHTSDQHPWFVESRSSKDNPHRDWYIWAEGRGNRPPNNWASVFGGKGWELDPATGQYYFHMFYKEQPDLNWHNPAVREEMLNVFRFWLQQGVDGFRLDVFNVYFKHKDLQDNPAQFHPVGSLYPFIGQRHTNDCDQPEMLPLLSDVRAILDEKPGRYVVGETFLSTPESAARYCGDNLLHAAFNFQFLHCRWKPGDFLKSIQKWEQALSPETFPNYVLSNHDVVRAATRYGRGESDERLKVAAALLLTQRGTPYIYYGEEIGMRDIPLTRDMVQDPIGKRFWPFMKGRDGCRSPMQWNADHAAGFSAGQPWLPVNKNYVDRNVESQTADPDSLFNFYRKLIQLRRETPVLREGMFVPLTFDPRAVLAYLRKDGDQTIMVALNFSRRRVPFVLGSDLARGRWRLLLSSKRDQVEITDRLLPLEPEEAVIMIQE